MLSAVRTACFVLGTFAAGSCAAHAQDATACAAAGTAAERQADLPPGLLLAIGRVESGRLDPATGIVAPWPWTINVAGAGHSFASADAARAAVSASLAQGVGSIDIGCFQINLQAHPHAFATLEEGFDPAANAAYAARFLSSLHTRLDSWEAAVAAYHSATPERGGPYRDQVMAVWGGHAPPAAMAPAATPVVTRAVVQTIVWKPSTGVRVWSPSAGGGASVIHFAGAPAPPAIHAPRG